MRGDRRRLRAMGGASSTEWQPNHPSNASAIVTITPMVNGPNAASILTARAQAQRRSAWSVRLFSAGSIGSPLATSLC